MVPASWSWRDALLLARHDVERQHRQHRAVHGHRHRHLVERDAVEQHAHVVDRVDRHAGHADVARHAWVVGVVPPVGRQVERDRQALLTGGQVAAVEGVGVLGGREAGVLADRPRLVDVHGRVRTTQEGGDARVRVEEVEALQVGGAVERLDVDALGRAPRRCRRRTPGRCHRSTRSARAGRAGRSRGPGSSSVRPGGRHGAGRGADRLVRPLAGRRARRRPCARTRSTPAAVSASRRSPGLPARYSGERPAADSAVANSTARSA